MEARLEVGPFGTVSERLRSLAVGWEGRLRLADAAATQPFGRRRTKLALRAHPCGRPPVLRKRCAMSGDRRRAPAGRDAARCAVASGTRARNPGGAGQNIGAASGERGGPVRLIVSTSAGPKGGGPIGPAIFSRSNSLSMVISPTLALRRAISASRSSRSHSRSFIVDAATSDRNRWPVLDRNPEADELVSVHFPHRLQPPPPWQGQPCRFLTTRRRDNLGNRLRKYTAKPASIRTTAMGIQGSPPARKA